MTTAPPAPDTVDAATVIDWAGRPDDVTIVDVRSPAEFETMHIPGSYNVPITLLGEHAAEFAARLDRKVVLVCQTGVRASQARLRLAGVGAENLHILDGGVPAFASAGGDVVRGQARWAMDRQVRLAAGSLVLASILTSLKLPSARFVAGGIGAGLTYAAATDSCAMSKILGMLPYNKGPADRSLREVLGALPSQQSAA
ncbi:MAG: rhodanese-like domain-containing protein [Micrococcales bacterium]|nr:rhodanese-like domain-containing protein [Micrococcales bacterium]